VVEPLRGQRRDAGVQAGITVEKADAKLLAGVPYMTDAAPLVRHAQERLDGLGYPAGNGAGSIALGARIIAAADAFDVMIRPRVFRDAVSRSAALIELERCSGTQFDPAVVQAVVAIVDRD